MRFMIGRAPGECQNGGRAMPIIFARATFLSFVLQANE
jgi:hypothetical protein